MSENKYIIDKDSLTGIADAVRDKLGTGEATTDPQTGDIVYPEGDKGYYLEEGKIAGFIYPNTSAAHYSSSELISVSHATILELCGGINPSFIKFTVLTQGDRHSSYNTPSRTLYNGVYFYSGEIIPNNTTLLKNVVGATKKFAYTGQGCYITGEEGYYSGDSYYSFPGVLQIEFLNENKQNIEAAIDGPIAGTSRYTMEIPNGEVPTKIPFTINDIQDKITNYLQGSNEIGPIPTAAKSAQNGAYSVHISSIFTSIQDFRNRFLQANVDQGTGNGFLYLISKKNGKPASMKELDIPLPSDIKSGVGGWDMAGVRLAYENNLTFPLCYVGTNGHISLGYYWLYVPTSLNWIVFCSGSTVGQHPSNSGSIYIAYLE